MAKRYRWIKIEEDFFRQKEVKAMRRLEGGDSYLIIYQKMMAHSLKNDNKMYFDNVEDSFEEEISLMIDEDVENIKATLEFLKKVNLVEWVSEDELVFNQVDELTGSESESKQRVRKHRMAKKINESKNSTTNVTDENLCNDTIVTKDNQENKNVTLEKEIEKEKELEKDTDIQKNNLVGECVDENQKRIIKIYEDNIGVIYPANRKWFFDISKKIESSLFEKAVQICIDKSKVNPSYLKGVIKKFMEQNIYTLQDYIDDTKNKQNISNVKPLYNYSLGKSSNTIDQRVDENDKDMLEEIKILEEKMGIS